MLMPIHTNKIIVKPMPPVAVQLRRAIREGIERSMARGNDAASATEPLSKRCFTREPGPD